MFKFRLLTNGMLVNIFVFTSLLSAKLDLMNLFISVFLDPPPVPPIREHPAQAEGFPRPVPQRPPEAPVRPAEAVWRDQGEKQAPEGRGQATVSIPGSRKMCCQH